MELSSFSLAHSELLHLDDTLWVLTAPTGVSIYDFRFDTFFRCRLPWQPPDSVIAVARIGAIPSYDTVYDALQAEGTTLLHDPEEYHRATNLPGWYPLLEDLTPQSVWFSSRPSAADVAAHFDWPVFLKGTRQTSRHRRALSIIDGPEQFTQAMDEYQRDPILRSQGIVCREYVRLRAVEDVNPDRIPSSFEFRTFWWKGELAGYGRYWWEGRAYQMTPLEEKAALAVANEAARRVNVPFLVVDIAQSVEGRWLVIECNDAQESGYGGVPPVALWQKIIDLERARAE